MNIKNWIIILSCLIICSCGNKRQIDIENEKSKRLNLFPEEQTINFESSSNYFVPTPEDTFSWITTDGAQTYSSPENLKIAENLNSKKILNLNVKFNKLDEFIPTPIVDKDTIYIKNYDSLVSAYNLDSGKKIWSQYMSEDKVKNKFVGGGLALYDNIYSSYGSNEIVALDTITGEKLWDVRLSSIVRSTPVYSDGKIFVLSLEGKLFVLNAKNGNLLYAVDNGIQSLVRASKAAVVADGKNLLVIPTSSGIIHVINQNSAEGVWSQNISLYENPLKSASINDISMTPVIKNGVIYVSSQIGCLNALDLKSGELIWTQNLGGVESVWVAGDGLFAIDDSNHLWHFNKTNGLARWKINLVNYLEKKDKIQGQFFGPIMANGNLLISSSFGKLLFISAKDGSLVKTHQIPKERSSIPMVVNGKILVLSESGKLTILSSK